MKIDMSSVVALTAAAACMIVPSASLAQTSTGGGASSGGSVSSPSSPSSPGSGGISDGSLSGGTIPPSTLSPGAPLRPSSPALRAMPPSGSAAGADATIPLRNDPAGTDQATDRTPPSPPQESGGTMLPSLEPPASTSGAPPEADTEAPIGPDQRDNQAGIVGSPNTETGGGSARTGATGKTLEGCMAAWEPQTHMDKNAWRRTCMRTLERPHI